MKLELYSARDALPRTPKGFTSGALSGLSGELRVLTTRKDMNYA